MGFKISFLMSKYKVLFEGNRIVVIQLRDGVRAQDLINEGVLIQRADGLYTKDNKRVIVSKSGFFLMSKPKLVGSTSSHGGCGGSVFEISGNEVMTAGHVLECVNRLEVDNNKFVIRNKRFWMPKTYPSWVWSIFREFGIKPSSPYDYGTAEIVNYTGDSYNTTAPYPRAVYVAGNCLNMHETDCLGIALATPDASLDSLHALVDRQLIVDCTYWNYEAIGWGMDVGEAFVDYGNGRYALLKPALLIRFLDKAGIPGCSGSMVYPSQPS